MKTNEELANEEYDRRLRANDKAGLYGRRGVFPMYHQLFYQYLRWVLAEISPFASPLPLHWSQGEEHVRHASYFGKQWGLHNVDKHLSELLGKQFVRIFGREATVENYQYVAEIINKTELKYGSASVTMGRANVWLKEQIAQLIEASTNAIEPIIPVAESATVATQLPQAESVPRSLWEPLLMGRLSLPAFYSFLQECGLLAADGGLTPLGNGTGLGKARVAPWVGTLRALIEAKLLDSNAAAICRALTDSTSEFKVKFANNSLLNPSDKSAGYQQVAGAILIARGLVR